MKIKSIQKTTLIDYPGKIACTFFLFGCNFKCGFCHNPGLVLKESEKTISEKEVLEFLNKRKKQLEGVCITGGEPLLDLKEDFLKKIKNLGYSIKIDTNGGFPEKLKKIIEKNLVDFVAMDLKSSKENYKEFCGVKPDLKKIEESMKLISKLKEYEFRTTVLPVFEVEEIEKIAKWIVEITGNNKSKYFLQKFVPRKNGLLDKKFESFISTPDKKLEEILNKVKKILPNTKIR